MIELRLSDGTRLDLNGDEIIAITYAINDIASIETRQGVTSNEFNLPITDFNLEALGYPTNFNVNQDVNPFKKIPAEIYEEDLRIAKGYIQITDPSLSEQVIPVTFFGENADWFNLIKGKSIRELDLSEWRHVFNPSTIKASFQNTEGYKYSLIDRNGINFLNGDDFSSLNFTLCVYQTTIAKAIINEIGFKIDGTLLNDPLYKKTLIADTNDRFYALDNNRERVTSLGTVQTTYPAATVEEIIVYEPNPLLSTIVGDNYINGVYTADAKYLANIASTGLLENIGAGPTNVLIELQVNGVTEASASNLVPAGNQFPFQLIIGDVFLAGGLFYQLEEGDQVRTIISTDNEPVELKSTSITDLGTGLGNLVLGSFKIAVENVAEEGSNINIEAVLPDIDQADFINDFVFDHNALITVNLNTKTISFDLKKYNIDNSIDWSNVIDLSKAVDLSYTDLTENYTQINDVKRAENDDAFIVKYNNNKRIKYGDGQFNLNNDFLEKRSTLFESEFSSVFTINSLDTSQPLPYIPGEEITDLIDIQSISGSEIRLPLDSNLDSFLEDTPANTIWLLVTNSTTAERNRAYSISGIFKDPPNDRYTIVVNASLGMAPANGIVRLIKRSEEVAPRKLIDGGNYLFSEVNDVFDSYNITSILPAPEDTVNITEFPYLYFWNPIVVKSTDENNLSLSYGQIDIPSLSNDLLATYYEQTIRILQSGKVLRASFRLNQVDIFNLDFNKLIYLNFFLNGQTINGYFILNKIEEYTGNDDSTLVELIKI